MFPVGKMADKRKVTVAGAAIACALLGGALYVNTLNCGFAFDDKAVILDNQDLRPNVSWSNVLLNDYWGTPMSSPDSHKSYRPLTVATFRLNYMLHELQPLGYHLVNVLLHSAVCYLYVLLCGVVFSEVWPALIAGLLFAVHPIHTEAVAGLVGRAELLSCLFFLLSLIYYAKAVHSQGVSKDLLWSLLCIIASLLSKEQGITVVAVCVAYDLFVANQVTLPSLLMMLHSKTTHVLPRLKAMWRRTLIMTAFTVCVLGFRLWMMRNRPTFNSLDNEGLLLDPPYRGLHWCYLIVINSWLLLNPSHLIHDYRMGAIPLLRTMTDPRHLLTALTFAAYLFLGLFSLGLFQKRERYGAEQSERRKDRGQSLNGGYTRSQRMLLFGLSMLVFPFIPASNLFMTVGFVVAERVLYLPSLGICFVIGYGFSVLLASPRKVVRWLTILGLVFILLSYSVKVVKRNPDWDSKLTLYEAGVRLYPHNGDLLGNIGVNYRRRGDTKLAELVYQYGMRVAPNASLPYMNYGIMLKEDKRFEEAEKVLKQAAEKMLNDPHATNEKTAKVFVTVGNMLSANESRLEEALYYVSKGVEVLPSLANAHNSRGSVLHKMRRMADAKAEFEEAIKWNPNYANAHFNLGLVLYQSGDTEQAVQEFRKTLQIDPNHTMAQLQMQNMRENGEIPSGRAGTGSRKK